MVHKKLSITIAILGLACIAKAQPNLSAYSDIQNRFYVFDNGGKTQLEGLQPRNYKIGRSGLAYMDNLGIFKVYRDGMNNTINNNFTQDYGVTDNFIYYTGGNSLSVIDGNEDKTLTRWVGDYAVGDSVILFFDKVRNVLNAYYDGKTTELESNLANTDFTNFTAKDNVIAYVNFMNQLKVFWAGHSEVLEMQPVTDIQVGRNTVAYVDVNGQFKIWHAGTTTTIDAFTPVSFKVGDNVVAYQSYDGNFKIFYKGEISTIGFFKKDYNVADNVVVYQDGNNWSKLFYKGATFDIDNFYPSKMVMGYNSFAYVNKANVLRMFQGGKLHDVSTLVSNIDDVQIDYDVLRYKVGLNLYRFFAEGKEF